ncbi:hypothetical protein GWR55_17850 [Edaphobacter sp. 12200R-103]|nr:hypothetical protein [Edaphobacter sp. 12200R-103]QHS53365.1 hypothetical protein GWR55_17850 [Edaphobacter sp. 12200R-103]
MIACGTLQIVISHAQQFSAIVLAPTPNHAASAANAPDTSDTLHGEDVHMLQEPKRIGRHTSDNDPLARPT